MIPTRQQSGSGAAVPGGGWRLGTDGVGTHVFSANLLRIAFIVGTVACLLVGQGGVLRFLYPLGALIVSAYLFQFDTTKYPPFVIWLWFLTPFVRRLVDYEAGWSESNPIMLAPVLATLISSWTVVRNHSILFTRRGLPFTLGLAAVAYGMTVGLLRLPAATVASTSLFWIAPIVFGFHLLVVQRESIITAQLIARAFMLGVLYMGVYGIVQFIVVPPWDQLWMVQSGMLVIGSPEPFKVRVFSTMNNPSLLGGVLMAGLLWLLVQRGPLLVPASTAGYLTLLLCQSRTAWLGWSVGFLGWLASLRGRQVFTALLVAISIAVVVIPLASVDPFAEVIQKRFQTMQDISDDVSLGDRLRGYAKILRLSIDEPFGKGIGVMDVEHGGEGGDEGGPHDSAFLELLLSLGWVGAAVYLTGLALFLKEFLVGASGSGPSTPLTVISRSIVVGTLAQFPLQSAMIGIQGIILWGFAGLAISSTALYEFGRTADSSRVQSSAADL